MDEFLSKIRYSSKKTRKYIKELPVSTAQSREAETYVAAG